MPSDEGSAQGRQLRDHLTRAAEAMRGLEASCAAAIKEEQLAPAERYEAFFAVLARDAESSAAAIELVLAQPAISSQLIDNLNASIHLRALLTDLFLVAEILGAAADAGEGAGCELRGWLALTSDSAACILLRFSITSSIRATRARLPTRTHQCRLRIPPAAMF